MILRELIFSNFLVFCGEQKLTFPSEEAQNVTLILANNNSGKTSIIRALKFLFYGSKALALNRVSGRPSAVISERAAHETPVGQDVEGWVDLLFMLGDQTYRFRRTVTATMTRDGLDQGTELLTEFIVGEHRTERHEDDANGTLEAKLRNWMPRGLFDAFYFQGEPLDGRMLEGVSTISTSLSGFLHIDKWEEAADALAKVQQDYERQLQTIAAASTEYRNKLNTLQATEDHLADTKALVAKLTVDLQELEARESVLSEELRRLGDTSEHERLLKRRDELKEKCQRLNAEIDRAHDRLAQIIEASQGAPFLLSSVEPARRILSAMEKDNVLPPDVTEGFVQRVLGASACVCGRPHTDESRHNWERYLEKALSAKLSHQFLAVLNRVSEGSHRGPVEQAASTMRDIRTTKDQIASLKKDLHAARNEIDNVDELIRQSPYANQKEKILATIDALRATSARLRRAQGEKGQLEGVMTNIELTATRLRREAKAAEPKGKAGAQITEVQRAIEIARELKEFIAAYRIDLRKRLYQQLQVLVADNYDPHSVDRTKARIDAHSLLPYIVNQSGQQQALVGGGQQTLLSLAYVSALAQLRKGIHETMRELNLYLGKADDQSFVVDSPFSATDPNYVRAIASFLVGGARQVIILMARQQWDQAGQHLLSKASKVYALCLYTKIAELKNLHVEDFDFDVDGRTHRLIAEVPDVKQRFSKILEIS